MLTAADASALSVKPEAKVARHCLYHSESLSAVTQHLAKQIRITDCELINATAFDGTTCVDDLVQDGATYVMAAVNAKGQSHLSPKRDPAEIPDTGLALLL